MMSRAFTVGVTALFAAFTLPVSAAVIYPGEVEGGVGYPDRQCVAASASRVIQLPPPASRPIAASADSESETAAREPEEASLPPSAQQLEASERADKAGERKFIRDHRTTVESVRARLGEPDARRWQGAVEVWTYEPTALDPQTRTTIQFDAYGYVFQVLRTVVR